MKVSIDLNDLKQFVSSLDSYSDEWYGPVNFMTGDCILQFLIWNNNKKIAKEFEEFLDALEVD